MGSHGEDGSRTPGRSGAWDPTVSNTPAQPGSFDNYDFDETSPSPNYNPGTPGTPGYSAEGSGPYTPTTPSSAYNPQDYSPYQPSPSPYQSTPSPKVMFQLLPLQEAALISHHHPLVM